MSTVVSEVLEQTTFQKILAGRACDLVDRLHHKVTVTLLISFAIVVSAKQFVGEPIHCWIPAYYKEAWHKKYIDYHCWVQNTYFVSFEGDEQLPVNVDERTESEITYYQWVPLILLLIALMCLMPHLVYRVLCSYSGVNLSRIADLADKYMGAKQEDRENTIDSLTVFIDRWLRLMSRKRELTRCHQVQGRYLVFVYLLTKLLYLIVVIGVYWLLKAFLGLDYLSYGVDVIERLSTNENIRESPRFPRVTFCDVKLRQLQNVNTYTVQCVLPINLFSEKIFVFLWFWFLILGIVTLFNMVMWVYTLTWRGGNYSFVRKHLVLNKYRHSKEPDKVLCRRFAEHYISTDGCFLFRMMAINSTDLVVNDVMDRLWQKYRKEHRTSVNHTSGDLNHTSGNPNHTSNDLNHTSIDRNHTAVDLNHTTTILNHT